ncbi:hypothetical protein AOQ84DRAFT_123790 [Glonium stellatum]|uniref:Uncharacterized protein n=1 Tax=Glonium stellatum TaxID=574774 RepID=A0A8E2ET43_9PEZI|nr:hypothetical protein AOQ84DRAFT_123790 [Glonium stellatum]
MDNAFLFGLIHDYVPLSEETRKRCANRQSRKCLKALQIIQYTSLFRLYYVEMVDWLMAIILLRMIFYFPCLTHGMLVKGQRWLVLI